MWSKEEIGSLVGYSARGGVILLCYFLSDKWVPRLSLLVFLKVYKNFRCLNMPF